MRRWRIKVRGTVQGVGFRPFVYRLADSLSLSGFVRNTPEGVWIEIEGSAERCALFCDRLKAEAPPMARITDISCSDLAPTGFGGFLILPSGEGFCETFISPDIGICDDCLSEIADKADRRFGYAFTNCTNCGPRFSIIESVPYDRANTSMNAFAMCADCREEYGDPKNRRFHAQPDACPACGPRLSFIRDGQSVPGDPLQLFTEEILKGRIVAVKGLGGYHLACDAENEAAVQRLREKKLRYEKPLAVMMRNLNEVKRHCMVNSDEEEALLSPQKPIILLKKREDSGIAYSVTAGDSRLGVMLPYTPLHALLLSAFDGRGAKDSVSLVMTSGNLSDNPMVYKDEEAIKKLSRVADAMLTHDRRIVRRVDDSVGIVSQGRMRLLRRARGYAPEPLFLSGCRQVILAGGAQQKNTFCLTKGENAFLSGHIGDLDDEDTVQSYESELKAFLGLFDAVPDTFVCDLHPDYVSAGIMERMSEGRPLQRIQHHHAHFASVLAEHRLKAQAIGFSFDGAGYGEDTCIWGGEALFGGVEKSQRLGHNLYFPLLGGDGAVREPKRCALATVNAALGKDAALSLFEGDWAPILLKAGETGLNAPMTSSMGRLFDAVSAIAGVCTKARYEGQAAVELMRQLDFAEKGSYHFGISEQDGQTLFDWRPVIAEAFMDRQAGIGAGVISRRFHSAVVSLITEAALRFENSTGCKTVTLSGGVFQNEILLGEAFKSLSGHGFTVYTNEKVPCNDGGISFGQAAAASYRTR